MNFFFEQSIVNNITILFNLSIVSNFYLIFLKIFQKTYSIFNLFFYYSNLFLLLFFILHHK